MFERLQNILLLVTCIMTLAVGTVYLSKNGPPLPTPEQAKAALTKPAG